MRYLALIFVFTLLAGAPKTLLAVEGQPCGVEGEPPCKIELPNPLGSDTSTVETLANRIVDWLVTVAAPIAAVMIIYGAFQMLFAGGNPEKFGTGRKTILYAVVGYGIIFIGWGLVSIIEKLLTTSP